MVKCGALRPNNQPGMGLDTSLLVFAVVVVAARLVALWARGVRGVFRMAKVSASIPGPPTLPLIGNFLDVTRGKLQNSFQAMNLRYGFLFRLWFGPVLMVCVFDAKDAEAVVTSPACSAKPWLAYRLLVPVIGKGMVVLSGSEHRRHRKLVLPSLHRDILNQFQPLMQVGARELANKMEALAATGEVFNATPLAGMAAVDSAFRTVLNADNAVFEALESQRRLVVQHVERLSHLLMYRVVRPWWHLDWLFAWSENHEEFQRLTAIYDHLIAEVLALKKSRCPERPDETAAAPGTSGRRRLAFLDHVLASEEGRSLSREELNGELKTMLAASFATSQDSMSVCLLLLSMMPEVQARIQQELDDVLGSSDRDLELSDLDHLDYLERFVKESLRYLPPFPFFARTCESDVALPSGHTLPAGCIVGLSPLATHHNPEYYPEPRRFDPDRFLPEVAASRPPCAFLPFSAGPRNCIGARYAMLFLKTHLACVLRRLVLLPDPDGPEDITKIRMRLGVTYYPRDGARVRAKARTAGRPQPREAPATAPCRGG